MLSINIPPYIFKFGNIELRYYGLVYAIGFLSIYYLLSKNREKLEMDRQQVDSLVFYLMIGLIIGARIMHFLINDPSIYWTDPLRLFQIWKGGMSFFGGAIGGTLAGYLFIKYNKLNFSKIADIVAIPATIALIFGRLANLINQELVGTLTNLPWCFNFENYTGCRHPYQIYASLSHVVLLAILLKTKKTYNGRVAYNFFLYYAILRFITDFVRDDTIYLIFTSWQWISLIMIGFLLIFKKRIKKVLIHQN